MILWIILILIAITILFLLWWYADFTDPPAEINSIETEFHPTIHARCQSSLTCGGDMICDLNCHRCRKQLGGDCANDVDCEFGLRCRNWKCGQDDPESSKTIEPAKVTKTPGKTVRWADIE